MPGRSELSAASIRAERLARQGLAEPYPEPRQRILRYAGRSLRV
ncbi:MAG: hypothetical protein V3V67_11120 [Myxococcota bacterium]